MAVLVCGTYKTYTLYLRIPFVLSQLGAEFAVFSPRVTERGNSNVLVHFSSTSTGTRVFEFLRYFCEGTIPACPNKLSIAVGIPWATILRRIN